MKLFNKQKLKSKTLIWLKRIHWGMQIIYCLIGFILITIDIFSSANARHLFTDFMDLRLSFILLIIGVIGECIYYLFWTIIPNFYKEYYLKWKYRDYKINNNEKEKQK